MALSKHHVLGTRKYMLTFWHMVFKIVKWVEYDNDVLIIVVVYVNDMLLTSPIERQIVGFKADLNVAFEMLDMGLLHHYLSI